MHNIFGLIKDFLLSKVSLTFFNFTLFNFGGNSSVPEDRFRHIDLDSREKEILGYLQSGGIGTAMINSHGGIMEVTIFGFHGNQGNIVLSSDSDLEKFSNLITHSLIQKNSNGKYEISENGKLFFEQKHA